MVCHDTTASERDPTIDELAVDRGRILLICFRFGPGCDTGGFRWNAMVRDLTQRGWRFDVITVGSLVAEGGSGRLDRYYFDGAVEAFQVTQDWWGQRVRDRARTLLEIVRRDNSRGKISQDAPSRRPNSSIDALRRCTVNVTEIMRDMDWVRRARKIALDLAQRRSYHCVIASSPRHLTQLIGAEVAARTGIAYLPDFRDPWYYGRGRDQERLDRVTRLVWRQAERRCMRQARLAIDISEGAQRAVQNDLPRALSVPRHFIPSGYDRIEDIAAPDSDCFRIVYTGTVYPFNPVPALLTACARLRDLHDLPPERLSIEFIGRMPAIDGYAPQALAEEYGLGASFTHCERVPAERASALQQRAAVLIAFDSVCVNALCIPSKLYHYAQMKGELVLIGDPEGAMALEAGKIGINVQRPGDTAALGQALERAYRRWRDGLLTERNDRDGQFDSRRQSRRMHELLLTLDSADTQTRRANSTSRSVGQAG